MSKPKHGPGQRVGHVVPGHAQCPREPRTHTDVDWSLQRRCERSHKQQHQQIKKLVLCLDPRPYYSVSRVEVTTIGQIRATLCSAAGLPMQPVAPVFIWTLTASGKPLTARRSWGALSATNRKVSEDLGELSFVPFNLHSVFGSVGETYEISRFSRFQIFAVLSSSILVQKNDRVSSGLHTIDHD